MQTKEQIVKTVKVVVVCVILFIVLLLVYHYFINQRGKVKPIRPEKSNYTLSEVNEKYENPSYCDGGYFLVEEKENANIKTHILDNELKTIETIDSPKTNVYCLYDGYYLINNNGSYTLKRKGSIIKSNLNLENNEVMKDESDNLALFVATSYLKALVNKEIYFKVNDIIYAGNYLINVNTGQTIDNAVRKAYKVNIKDVNDIIYLYVESNNNYIWDIKNNQKLLENKKIIFNRQDQENVYNNSQDNFILNDETGSSIVNINGNTVVSSNMQTIKLDSNNQNYFAVNRNKRYGLINSFDKIVWDFSYDNIIVLDNFIMTIKDNKLDIYNSMLKKINDNSYNVRNNNIEVNKFDSFYQIKGIYEDGAKELILLDNGSISMLNSIRLVEYSDYFYNHPCYFINEDGKYYVYITSDDKKYINTEFKNNVDHVLMLNNNRLYTDFAINGKTQYGFYRINTGVSLGAYIKDKLDVDLEVIKNDKYVFSRENNVISVYFNNILQDEIKAQKISVLKDNYYRLETEEKVKLVKIG